jgi:beta-barrel assembly-enhancing protease
MRLRVVRLWVAPIAAAGLLGACGGNQAGSGSSSSDERLRQQTQALRSELAAQARLDNVAYPLLRSALPFCGNSVGYRTTFRVLNVGAYTKNWIDAARQIGMSDTLSVATVARGSSADRAGLRVGDRIVAMGDRPAPVGKTAIREFSDWLEAVPRNETSLIKLTVLADSSAPERSIAIPQEQLCSYGIASVGDPVRNATVDGQNVYVTSAMQAYARSDEDLAVVLAHEIAHSGLNHAGNRKRNSTIGAILGAAVDVAAGMNGVNTQGIGSGIGGNAGARAYSQEFERDADYVGMYILARADFRYDAAIPFWHRVADEKVTGNVPFLFKDMHPANAERFTKLDQAALEIDRKKAAGLILLPNRR